MGKQQRDKGARGERELAKELYDRLGIELKRNLEQSRNGGYDLEGMPKFAIEVKRHEKLEIAKWWAQATEQARLANRVPVLAWRQSRKPWAFRTELEFVNAKFFGSGFSVDMDIDTFCYIVRERWL